jgi:protein O-GlcNAc transferase
MNSLANTKSDAAQIIADAWRSAVACHRAGRMHEAGELYTAILQADPAHADAHHNLGVLLVRDAQFDQSLPHFVAAIEAEPAEAQYWLSYVEALSAANRGEEARQVLALAKEHGLQGASVDALTAKIQ